MTPTFREWAKQHFADDVQGFGDDPHGVVGYELKGELLRKAVTQYYVDLQAVATELGLDFWAIAADQCTEQEILRLKNLLF